MSNSTNSSNDNTGPPRTNSGLGAATYYGAVAVVVFVLVGLTVVTRVLYTRKARRLARQHSIESTSRDTEERVAMERRGEAVGLPTYRESVLPTSRNPILDSTPLSNTAIRTSSDTIPPLTVMTAIVPPSALEPQISPPAYRIPPPKYEDAEEEDTDPTNQIVGQAIDSEDHSTHHHPAAVVSEMRMTNENNSVVTLVIPGAATVQALNPEQPTIDDQQQSTNPDPVPHSPRPPPPPPPLPTNSESNQN